MKTTDDNLIHIYKQLGSHPHRILVYLFVLCIVFYLVTILLPRTDGMLIGSDGVGYYVYVRSLVLDRDLDFSNEYARLYPNLDVTSLRTPTGLVANQYAIGSSILWLPFFLAAHFIVLGLQGVGFPVLVDGYNYIYQAAICLGSLTYGFLGILLIYQVVERFYSYTALAALLLIWLATNFIYYLVIEPSMSHMCAFFSVALLLNVWIRSRPIVSLLHCLAIGLAGGLIGIVRQPDATLLALPIIDCILCRTEIISKLKQMATILIGFVLIFWLQMMVWQILNGNPFLSGYFYRSTQHFVWLSPHLVDVLFSTEHGLFLWHPILLFAVAGFVPLSQIERKLSFLFIIGILIQAYIIASWSSWTQADSFGGRMFISSLPMFSLGLGACLHWASKKQLNRMSWILSICLIVWNSLFLIQYRLGFISMCGPYTLQQLTIGKFEMLVEIGKKVLRLVAR